jgi:hypothetical protein
MGPVVHNGRVVVLEIVGRVKQTLLGKIMQKCCIGIKIDR